MKTFSDYGIDLGNAKGSGAERKTTCPQCSASRKKSRYPCLSVNIDKGIWHCHHCEWSGSIQRGEENRSAPPRYKVYRRPDAAPQTVKSGLQEWFEGRGIPWEIVQRYRISLTTAYFPQTEEEADAIAFPYYRAGELINHKYRTLEGKNFRMDAAAERILYGMDDIQGDTLIWCEGEIDALSLATAGYQSVVSVPDGAPAPNTKNYETKFGFLQSAEEILSPIRRHVLAVDNDLPGQTLAKELARRLGPEKCFVITWASECKDANDVLMSYGVEVLHECIDHAEPYPIDGIITPGSLRDAVLALYHRGYGRGLSTGWNNLDQHYTIRPGEWTLISGIPSHGKSSVLSAMAVQFIKATAWPFAMCVPEQQPLERYIAMLSQLYSGAPFYEGPSQRMLEAEVHHAIDWLDTYIRFLLPQEDTPTLSHILDLAKVEVFRSGIKGLIIDPFNELDHHRPAGMNETEYISSCLTQIRQFARRYDLHVWVVAHPTKLQKESDGTYPVPLAYDIAGSAAWYNKADNILSIWRDVKEDSHIVKVHIQKIRFRDVGRPGVVQLRYHPATGRLSEIGASHA